MRGVRACCALDVPIDTSDGATSDLAFVLACPLLLIAVVSGSGTTSPQSFEMLFFCAHRS